MPKKKSKEIIKKAKPNSKRPKKKKPKWIHKPVYEAVKRNVKTSLWKKRI